MERRHGHPATDVVGPPVDDALHPGGEAARVRDERHAQAGDGPPLGLLHREIGLAGAGAADDLVARHHPGEVEDAVLVVGETSHDVVAQRADGRDLDLRVAAAAEDLGGELDAVDTRTGLRLRIELAAQDVVDAAGSVLLLALGEDHPARQPRPQIGVGGEAGVGQRDEVRHPRRSALPPRVLRDVATDEVLLAHGLVGEVDDLGTVGRELDVLTALEPDLAALHLDGGEPLGHEQDQIGLPVAVLADQPYAVQQDVARAQPRSQRPPHELLGAGVEPRLRRQATPCHLRSPRSSAPSPRAARR